MPDGEYQVVVTVRDGCLNLASARTLIVVDNTAPALAVSYPNSGDPLGIMIEVIGSVSDQHLAHYEIEDADSTILFSDTAPKTNEEMISCRLTAMGSRTWWHCTTR